MGVIGSSFLGDKSDRCQNQDVYDLIDGDHKPEKILNRLFAGSLYEANPPDDWPATVKKHMRRKNERQPPPVNLSKPEGGDEGEGIAKAVEEECSVEKATLRLVHRLMLSLQKPISNHMTKEKENEATSKAGHGDLRMYLPMLVRYYSKRSLCKVETKSLCQEF